jgi:transposase
MGWLPNRLPTTWPGLITMCQPVGPLPWRGSKEVRPLTDPELGMPATGPHMSSRGRGQPVAAVMIGVDPHKGSHTAVVIGAAEELLGQVRVRACAAQAEQLLAWAAAWPERTWAIEGAGGLGHLLAQQLVAAGERVLDVQPKLAARVRLLASGAVNKNDPNDARSVAVAALRSAACPLVRAEDHAAVLKVWAKRYRDLGRARNQVACRLHAVLCELVPGGVSKEITAAQAARILDQAEPPGAAGPARRELAGEFLADLAASTPSDATPDGSWPRRSGHRARA